MWGAAIFQHHGLFDFVFGQMRREALNEVKHVTAQERPLAKADFGSAVFKHMAGVYFHQVGIQLFAHSH